MSRSKHLMEHAVLGELNAQERAEWSRVLESDPRAAKEFAALSGLAKAMGGAERVQPPRDLSALVMARLPETSTAALSAKRAAAHDNMQRCALNFAVTGLLFAFISILMILAFPRTDADSATRLVMNIVTRTGLVVAILLTWLSILLLRRNRFVFWGALASAVTLESFVVFSGICILANSPHMSSGLLLNLFWYSLALAGSVPLLAVASAYRAYINTPFSPTAAPAPAVLPDKHDPRSGGSA